MFLVEIVFVKRNLKQENMLKCIIIYNTKYVKLKAKGEKTEMTCKDCINFNECLSKNGTTKYSATDIACGNVEKLCKYFKNKLHYIEIPCSIGDKAYYISYATKSYTLVEVKVIGFNITVCEIWGVVCKTDSYPFTLPIDEVYFNKLQAEKEIDKLNNTKTLKQG